MQLWHTLWDNLRASLWFVPTIFVLGALALAVGLVEIDARLDPHLWETWPRFFGVGADGARGTLAAVASSMITVAGVVFSITIVALSLASSQYSSRVLRHFMRDRITQTVLGVFVGVFAYCLIVLRTIRGGDEGPFVPSVAVMVGVMLAFAGIGFLIYFIHHIALSIQASHILAIAAAETLHTVDHLFPEDLGRGEDDMTTETVATAYPGDAWQVIPAHRTGYIQRIDTDGLLALACTRQFVVRMECGVGAFIIEGTPLVAVAGATMLDARAISQLQAVYTVNRQRTVDQDAAYGVQQIVDVALKALSPGINDTTTAVMSVDYLTAILARLARRRFEPPLRYAEDKLRVIACCPTFARLLAVAFDPIRWSAVGNITVLARLLEAVELLADLTTSPTRRQALLQQAQQVHDTIQRSVTPPMERQALIVQSRRVVQCLDGTSTPNV